MAVKKAPARREAGAHAPGESPLTRMLRAALAFFTGQSEEAGTTGPQRGATMASRAKTEAKASEASPP